jgi:hypothetical protein
MDGKSRNESTSSFACKYTTETLELLREAFGEHSLSRTAVAE